MSGQVVDDAILEVYIFELSQMVEQLETVILSCDQAGVYSPEMVNDIFRIMHTIKGSSSMMAYHNIATLAHVLEDLFSLLRQDTMRLDDYSKLTDLMLEGVDFIKVELEKIKNRDPVDGDSSLLIEQAKKYLSIMTYRISGKAGKEAEVVQNAQEQASPLPDASGMNQYEATVRLEDCGGMESVRAFQIIQRFKEDIEDLRFEPSDLETNFDTATHIRDHGFKIFINTEKAFDEVENIFNYVTYVESFEFRQIEEEPSKPVSEQNVQEITETAETKLAGTTATKQTSSQSSFISVNVVKLDELMDIVGELVIAEAMVTQNPDLQGLELDQFTKASRHLKKIIDDIQDKVMSIRMLPLANTFKKMNRIVRDMSKKLGKEVHLQLIGEDTEVDKNIIEHISDPLMHIVRNSIDHGLEPVEDRIAAGKPLAGTLILEAKNAGNEVVILVKDDGRGLNKQKLLKRARENGILYKNESEMTDSEIYNLIFLPGFSTKDKVTEFSGRGVGMDVVMKNIGSVGGTVSIESQWGKGTTIIIRIPLTLAIIDGMNLKTGNSRFTLPTTSIKESFRPDKRNVITDPDGNEMIMVRGQCYPIIRLHKKLGIQTDITDLEEGILIMADHNSRQVCIFADELLGQQQVVVKSLPAYLKRIGNVKGITGCTLLGDGSISLILDVTGLSS
ncbi:chemotaxis protein CheA [Bacillus sp. FJAT-18017]|uniref:chemotaxis protein CheA n=1 Tax=Bacillus sp. FJAT-18017 TaxID=1705566 RepID=UPI0006AE5B54|nr:chemotaxis protein CheA [Bacillus sp. FJAT-18017]ALC92282.1 chemotaxis protein CheA [Bacillus sp. FJAT-18017]